MNFGISRFTWWKGKHYVIYHALDFDRDNKGRYQRHTWVAPVSIRKNAKGGLELSNPTRATLKVTRKNGASYAMALKLKDGTEVRNCLYNDRILSTTSFTGVCEDGKYYQLNTIDSLVLAESTDGWKTVSGKSLKLNMEAFEQIFP